MSRHAFIGLLLCLAAVTASADNAAPIPVESFFSYSKISQVKISPDGKYLAMAVASDAAGVDRDMLVILNTADRKPKANLQVINRQSILNFWWANDERVLVSTMTETGSFDVPVPDGDLYAVNADGTKQKQLIGQVPVAPTSQADNFTHIPRNKDFYYFIRLMSVMPDDPSHVVVQAVEQRAGAHQQDQTYQLDIYSGTMRVQTKSPVAGGYLLADNAGYVRTAWGGNLLTGQAELFVKPDKESDDWIELKEAFSHDDPGEAAMQPLGYMQDDQKLYWLGRNPAGTLGLFTLDPHTQKQESLYGDPDNDLDYDPYFSDFGHDGDGLVWSFDYTGHHHVIAVETMPGLPAVHFLDGDDPKAGILASMYDAFPGEHVSITSNSRDGTKMVVFVSSDRNPGDFYLFDASTGKAEFLYAVKPEIDKDAMAPMQPVSFKARDGLTLHGYLTVPPGVAQKNLPMILLVHGGPHGIRDIWGFDPETQFFASRGYAVLQVNFRGSGGYGMDFQDAGYRQWAGAMQDDLADAVKWAVQLGYADPKRVCIYGASYGGYAALENPIRYPDLYKCAVGYVGVYDLTLLGRSGDATQSVGTQKIVDVYLGTDPQKRRQDSPAYNADKLKLPLLLAYGGTDYTAIPDHATEMLAALDKAGVSHEPPIYFPNEGHGFLLPEHRYELYTKMLAFIQKYIGPGLTAPPAPAKAP